MENLLNIMRRLRGPEGCPWDREQTHGSLRPYLLEEAAEAVDALGSGDMAHVCEELGDVLLQVAFHAVIAEETGTFDYDGIEQSICDKLVRRHPHVFGDVKLHTSSEVLQTWQAIKAEEKAQKKNDQHPASRIASSLGALERERQLQKILGSENVLDINHAVQNAQNTPEGVAQVLQAVVAWATSMGINPEIALRDSIQQRIETYTQP